MIDPNVKPPRSKPEEERYADILFDTDKTSSYQENAEAFANMIRHKDQRNENLWTRASWTGRIAIIGAGLIFLKALFAPVTHRLSPDIVDLGGEHPGQVTGFHYTKRSWWGFWSTTYDDIRFVKGRDPEYLDPDTKKWETIPSKAWGVVPEADDRDQGDYLR